MIFIPLLRRQRGCSSVVERHVANVNVEGSNPFSRFLLTPCCTGGFLLNRVKRIVIFRLQPIKGARIMLLRTVIGFLILTSVSAADWTVEVDACSEGPICESAVTYVPGVSFGASVSEPYPGAISQYFLVLYVTKTTTLKLTSAGSCSCPGLSLIHI